MLATTRTECVIGMLGTSRHDAVRRRDSLPTQNDEDDIIVSTGRCGEVEKVCNKIQIQEKPHAKKGKIGGY